LFEFDTEIICPQDANISSKRLQEYAEYYRVKHAICESVKPDVIVEIGVRAGYSAWTFMQACGWAQYFGIDANNGQHGGEGGEDGSYKKWAEHLLRPYDFELIDLDTQKVQQLPIKQADFFHIDGDHTTRGVMHDLRLCWSCLRPGGAILVDDVTFLYEVRVGVQKWLLQTKRTSQHCFISSFRGECLIMRKGDSTPSCWTNEALE
jgi:hypothetical protein